MSQQDANRQREIQERLERNRQIEERRRQEREEQERLSRMSKLERQRFLADQRDKAENEAKREAAFEAHRQAKAEGAIGEGGRVTVRQKVTREGDSSTISSRITRGGSGRSTGRERVQYAQSGEDMKLQGDPDAIRQVRAEAFQRARQKSGTVDQAAINRETRAILTERGGSVSVVDRTAQKQTINEAYADFKRDKSIPESDMAVLTPVQGIRSRSVYEGRYESGAIEKVTFTAPKTVKTVEVTEPVPRDFASGAAAEFQNIGEAVKFSIGDLFGGRQVPRYSYDPKTGVIISKSGIPDIKPTAEAEVFSAVGEGQQFLTVGGRPFGGSVLFTPSSFQNLGSAFGKFSENPAYFAGTVGTSLALWFGPGAGYKLARSFSGVKIPSYLKPEVVSTKPFIAIQKARPESSIFRYYVNYEKAPQLRGIARSFNRAQPIKSGAVSVDEVTLTKEFERAPFGRFVTERRPSVLGQSVPLTIEQELDLVRLNPSKPTRLPTLAEITKPEIIQPFKATGAPIKAGPAVPYQYTPPKLGDIMKSNLWEPPRSQGAPFKTPQSEFLLPRLRDIVKPDDITPRPKAGAPFATAPSEFLIPRLGDIMKSDLWKSASRIRSGAPFATGPSSFLLPKLGDILKPNLWKTKIKGNRSLSNKEISDLLDTLEGKKAIEPARNLLTRKEQGRLSGDFVGDSEKASAKMIDDMVKSVRKRQRKSPPGKAVAGASGQSSIVIGETVRASAPSAPTIPIKGSLGLGGGRSTAASVSLGFGSALTSRRRKRDESIFNTEIDVIRFPNQTFKSTPRSLQFTGINEILKNLERTPKTGSSKPDTIGGVRVDTFIRAATSQKPSIVERSITASVGAFGFPSGNPPFFARTPAFDTILRRSTEQITRRPPPTVPTMEMLFGPEEKPKKRKKGGKVRAAPRQGNIRDLVSVALGESNQIARDFRRMYDRSF